MFDGPPEIVFFRILFVGAMIYFLFIKPLAKQQKEKEKEKERKEKLLIEKQKAKKAKEAEIKIKLKKIDDLNKQLSKVQEIKIADIDISDLEKLIVDNEKKIIAKGGENLLFSFLKINTFLRDYKSRIESDVNGLNNIIDVKRLKSQIEIQANRSKLEKIHESLIDASAILEGRKTSGFESKLNNLFKLGEKMWLTLMNQILTMEYYKNMAIAMIVFYLNDKKIRYFEIYESFEKLGVFDSTWQKKVLNKLDTIDIRLAQISNQLTDLNQNFISLVNSSEKIVSELKGIKSGIAINNVLQSITAFSTLKMNKNTKSLKKN